MFPTRELSGPGSGRSRSASPRSCPEPGSRSPTAPPRARRADPAALAGDRSCSRPDRLDHVVERLEAVPADQSASQCGSAAAIPPVRGEKPAALTRGLTHTIRCARRARRSISRPTSVGSPRSQPSERITITAPRAIPRRPWRSLNAFSASPIRVPLDQSGAAAAARWIARSGLRDASARVRRVSRVANTNASAPLPPACHRRRTSETAGTRARRAPSSPRCRTADTIRRRTIRRRRRASRTGSPPVRRLPRSVRRRSIRSPW